jgi:hypothetical protein
MNPRPVHALYVALSYSVGLGRCAIFARRKNGRDYSNNIGQVARAAARPAKIYRYQERST